MLEISVIRRFEGFTLDAEFAAETSGVLALFGRSGSGKTTLVNILAGLETPDRGRVAIRGRTMFDSETGIDVAPEDRRLGYVFQDPRLFPHLSVRHNLEYGLKRAPKEDHGIAFDQVVELLGISPYLERRPHRLSGGERQRVAIGRALLAQPRLLLMDEPLASLDRARKDEILPFIDGLSDAFNIPIIYVTHSMSEIVRLARTMAVLSDGRVAAVGPVEEIMARLDLRPLTGRYEAGAVITATVAGHDPEFEITRLRFPGGTLNVAELHLPDGSDVRLQVRARDVALALAPPADTSIQNVLPATVVEATEETGPFVEVRLDAGVPLVARITRRSARILGIAPGLKVYALIKSVAIDRRGMGRPGHRDE